MAHNYNNNIASSENTNAPLCRCRVLYIGSAVPTVTKDGLQGIQQPLKERYPTTENTETKGIDSWLSVWSNGLLLEYVKRTKQAENAFFPITTLHYCAAVRYVNVGGFSIEGGGERFIPLDTPFAHVPNSPHPPMFAAIFRRTSGIKVLECHAFICTNEHAANALVRCCFHSYAESICLKMDEKLEIKNINESNRSGTPNSEHNINEQENGSLMAIDELREESNWSEHAIGQKTWQQRQQNGEYDSSSIESNLFKKPSKYHAKQRDESKKESLENDGILMPYYDKTSHFRNVNDANSTDLNNYAIYEKRSSFVPPRGNITCSVNNRNFDKTAYFPSNATAGKRPPFIPPFSIFNPNMPMMPMLPPPVRILPPHLKNKNRIFGKLENPPYPPSPSHMLLPHCFFMMQFPFHIPPQTNYFTMEQAAALKSTSDMNVGSYPIIQESNYDAFPRQGTTYEEPIYFPSYHSATETNFDYGPSLPHSNCKPIAVPLDNYESFYETYQKRKINHDPKKSDSDASYEDSLNNDRVNNKQFWEAYENSIYRKTHINEKAFANTISNVTNNRNDPNVSNSSKNKKEQTDVRPNTPLADYDIETLKGASSSSQKPQQNTATVY